MSNSVKAANTENLVDEAGLSHHNINLEDGTL